MMHIRRIRSHEGSRLRDIRLRALADAPTAFGSTLANEQARPATEWDHVAAEDALSGTRVRFVAEENGRWYGMAGGFVRPEDPETVQLVSMWVDPARRRAGLGTSLVETVVQWARGRAARRIQLWVTDTNSGAKSLYRRAGFMETDRVQPLPSAPALREVLMMRALGGEARTSQDGSRKHSQA